jgi:hypothetical protein
VATAVTPALGGSPDHVGSDPIIDGPAGDAVSRQPHHALGQHHGITDPDAQRSHLLARAGTHVDPEVLGLGGLGPLLIGHQMDRLLPQDSGNVTISGKKGHALAHQHLRVPPPDLVDVQVAILPNVGHLQADLVDVTRQHHDGATAGVHRGVGVAADVDPDVPGESGCFFPPHASRPHLKTRRSGGVQKAFEKGDVVGHGPR